LFNKTYYKSFAKISNLFFAQSLIFDSSKVKIKHVQVLCKFSDELDSKFHFEYSLVAYKLKFSFLFMPNGLLLLF